MVTYEEAKQIAQNTALGEYIDTAEESKTAYIFKNSEKDFAGGLPIVIVKKDGAVKPWFPYIQAMAQADFDSIHQVDFDIGGGKIDGRPRE